MLVAPAARCSLRFSLNRFDPAELMIEAVTPANYLRFFADPFYCGVLRTTVSVAAATTALCLLLGLPLAYRLPACRAAGRPRCMLAIVLPLFIGNAVRMVGWMVLFGMAASQRVARGLTGQPSRDDVHRDRRDRRHHRRSTCRSWC